MIYNVNGIYSGKSGILQPIGYALIFFSPSSIDLAVLELCWMRSQSNYSINPANLFIFAWAPSGRIQNVSNWKTITGAAVHDGMNCNRVEAVGGEGVFSQVGSISQKQRLCDYIF